MTTEFLPAFCTRRSAIEIVIFAEMLALIIVLSNPTQMTRFPQALLLNSLYIQALCGCSAALLCIQGAGLNRLRLWQAFSYAFLLIILLSGVISLIVLYFSNRFFIDVDLDFTDYGFILKNIAITAIVATAYIRYLYILRQERIAHEAHATAAITALQARIRPHFLFNSMNMIASLIQNKPDIAEQVVLELADLFRASLSSPKGLTALSNELELCQQYLHIEQLRLGKRLVIDWRVDVNVPVTIPSFLLQPLIENAIYHGIQTQSEGGTLFFQAFIENQQLKILIKNPANKKSMSSTHIPANPGLHEALTNIRNRLQLVYAHKASISLDEEDDFIYTRLTLPLG